MNALQKQFIDNFRRDKILSLQDTYEAKDPDYQSFPAEMYVAVQRPAEGPTLFKVPDHVSDSMINDPDLKASLRPYMHRVLDKMRERMESNPFAVLTLVDSFMTVATEDMSKEELHKYVREHPNASDNPGAVNCVNFILSYEGQTVIYQHPYHIENNRMIIDMDSKEADVDGGFLAHLYK